MDGINVGRDERLLRIGLAAAVLAAALACPLGGRAWSLLMAAAGGLLITGISGFCPLRMLSELLPRRRHRGHPTGPRAAGGAGPMLR